MAADSKTKVSPLDILFGNPFEFGEMDSLAKSGGQAIMDGGKSFLEATFELVKAPFSAEGSMVFNQPAGKTPEQPNPKIQEAQLIKASQVRTAREVMEVHQENLSEDALKARATDVIRTVGGITNESFLGVIDSRTGEIRMDLQGDYEAAKNSQLDPSNLKNRRNHQLGQATGDRTMNLNDHEGGSRVTGPNGAVG